MAGREDRKAQLATQLARARADFGYSMAKVRDEVDVPRRVRRSVANHAFLWVGGAAIAGFIIARLPRRTKKVYVNEEGKKVSPEKVAKTGLLFAAARIVFGLAQPILLKVAREQLEPLIHDFIQRRQQRQ
jgi:hypothetical protein